MINQESLMEMAAEKAIKELSWDSIEWLFKPVTMFELFLRFDLGGMKAKDTEWIIDDSPGAMPFRHRPPFATQMRRAIEVEEFYLKLKVLHEEEEK